MASADSPMTLATLFFFLLLAGLSLLLLAQLVAVNALAGPLGGGALSLQGDPEGLCRET